MRNLHPGEGPSTQMTVGVSPELRKAIDTYIDIKRGKLSFRAVYDMAVREMLEREGITIKKEAQNS